MAPPPGTTAPTAAAMAAVGSRQARYDAPAPAGSTRKAPRPRSFLNHQQRLAIIKKKDEEPKWTQVQLARWATVQFNLPKEPSQATIAILLKKRHKYCAATVRPHTRTMRAPRHPELEAALVLWVRYLQSKNVAFTGENIRVKASFLAGQLGIQTKLNFSTGWMSGFVNRHNLTLARAHKKKRHPLNDAPLRDLVRSYPPQHVFAMSEALLIYNALPLPQPTSDVAAGDRVCVGLCVNMDASERLEPFVVTTTPRKTSGLFGCYSNPDGIMTSRIFERWVYALNLRMAASDRKILLLVDTALSHFFMELSHVRVGLLPSVATLNLQPFDAGILKSFKALYRRTHLSFAVDQTEESRPEAAFDVPLPRALGWIKQAWRDISSDLIRSCWSRTGLDSTRHAMPAEVDVAIIHPEVVQSLVVSLSQLHLLDSMPIEALLDAPRESELHYAYDDSTIIRMVAGDSSPVDEDDDLDDVEDGAHNSTATDNASLERMRMLQLVNITPNPATAPAPMPTHPRHATPTAELLAHYRGVIASLQAERGASEDRDIALRFLRTKEGELLDELARTTPRSDASGETSATCGMQDVEAQIV
ncbi:hypothetical protein P43SY_004297 [Pythium insidiosum]|uniref:HTH CENPB-type domain-containing protein n=1 Tax=Pythium insidiosum TaxID=114742 RepID=A0AAD5Q8C7_PYTIN|nr:hypothetical protein P43SY_004297 [Pythium insidiosum]